jgi:cell division protein FtsL
MQRTEFSADRRWQNRAVHREVDAKQVRRMWKLVLAILVAFTPTAAYLVQINESVKVDYQVSRLRAEAERLREQKRRLHLERARLQSLARIEDWATRGRGLVRPGPHRVMVVRGTSEERGGLMAASPRGRAAEIQ